MSTTQLLRRGLAATAAIVALAACDKSSTGPSAMATLAIKNESAHAIQMVQIAKCTDEYWGGNRLGPSESMTPGATRSWSLEPGCWDIRLATTNHTQEYWDVDLQAGGSFQLSLTDAALSSLAAPALSVGLKR